jgi:hypothetical protein
MKKTSTSFINIRAVITIIAAMLFAAPAFAARGKVQGFVEKGGQKVTTGSSLSTTAVMQSYPGVSVTVYEAGTLTPATIYSDSAGTAKANPFSASSTAFYSFYTDSAEVDISFGGGAAYTLRGVTPGGEDVIGVDAVRDCQLDPTGATDNSALLQTCVNRASGPIRVTFPEGNYKFNSTVTIQYDRTYIVGAGRWVTKFTFTPTVDNQPLLHFTKGAGATTIVHCVISGIAFTSTDTTYRKTAVKITDGSHTTIEDIAIGPIGYWTGGSGFGSTGLHILGRDIYSMRRMSIAADAPIWFDDNPNSSFLDADHVRISDGTELIAPSDIAGSAVIRFTDNIVWSDFYVDSNAWIGGEHGLYYNGSGVTQQLLKMTLRNIRWEGPMYGSSGYMVWINGGPTLYARNLVFDQLSSALSRGIYLAGVRRASINTYQHATANEAITVSNTESLILTNVQLVPGATRTMTNMKRVTAMVKPLDIGADNTHAFEMWDNNAGSNYVAGRVKIDWGNSTSDGISEFGGVLTVPNGTANRVDIETGEASFKAARVTVACFGTTKGASGTVLLSPLVSPLKESGTALFDVGMPVGGIGVNREDSAHATISNDTGESQTCWYVAKWIQ